MQSFMLSNEDYLKESIKELFRCRYCKGEGQVINPYFEVCREDFPVTHDCKFCDFIEECGRGEIIPCEWCDGTGYERLTWEELYKRLTKEV